MTARCILILVALLASPLAAQDALTLRFETYYRISGASGLVTFGDVVLSKTRLTADDPVGVIRVDTKAVNVTIDVEGFTDRKPLTPTNLQAHTYMIDQPGHWRVDVTVIDFEKNIYGRKTVDVTVGAGPNPPPPIPDPPGPEPTPPTPDPPTPVPNEYGVGRVSYTNAPADLNTRLAYANIYRRAGDFLYGRPTLKFIVSSNQQHSTDPNRSVMAWISQQYDLVQCPDQATCEQWTRWKQAIRQAFFDSQTARRQYTREDWYRAFNEVANSLEVAR